MLTGAFLIPVRQGLTRRLRENVRGIAYVGSPRIQNRMAGGLGWLIFTATGGERHHAGARSIMTGTGRQTVLHTGECRCV